MKRRNEKPRGSKSSRSKGHKKPTTPTRSSTIPTRSIVQRWRTTFFIGGALALALLTYGLYQIDTKVQKRIHSLSSSTVPTIYSAPFDIVGFLSRSSELKTPIKEAISSMLSKRRYLEMSADTPNQQGTYSFVDNSLKIATREFRTASGELIPSRVATISLTTGKILAGAQSGNYPLLLEPEVVSLIGSTEIRASTFTPLNRIPLHLQNAVLAIEDERFYSHFGLDLIGISRAVAMNISAGKLVQGGSTLTQQLAKNLILSPRRTLGRKLLEIPTALSIERHLSKPQILELYLNEVYLGQEGAVAIHGMPEAAQTFFGKRIEQLSLAEAATLAGVIKAPSLLSPRKYAKKAKTRRNLVLLKMKELGMIDGETYNSTLKMPLKTTQHARHRRAAPYFVASIERELESSIDLQAARGSGLAVYTGLEMGMQRCAEEAIATHLKKIEAGYPRLAKAHSKLQAALVAIEPYSGLVKAWCGGRDFNTSQFDRVHQSKRQIGSTVKPFLYLTALDGSLNSYKVATATSILEDKPMEITLRKQATWIPENYDHDFRGDVTLRYALENSLNMPAIYVAQRVGIPALARTLENFRLSERLPQVPSLALGTVDTTLLQLTSAYGALANGGVLTRPRLFTAARDEDNEQLVSSEISEAVVADENAVYVLTTILQGVLDRGTGKGARSSGFSRPAAGKTGTSDDARDAWFVGFTPNLVTGVWVGLDDNSPLGLTGGAISSPIWGDFMKCASPYLQDSPFIAPRGVIESRVDTKTGMLATPDCPDGDTVVEVFVKGTEPTARCSDHGGNSPTKEYQDSEYQVAPRLPEVEIPQHRERSFWDSIFN